MDDWDSLRFVLAAGREQSLSAAARLLGVNHATVSRQIARYEGKLGQPLFLRLPDGLAVTETGRAVMAHAARVEEEVLSLDLALKAAQHHAEHLIITAPPLLVDHHFAQDIETFRARHPNVTLEILGENRVLNLHRREADVALRISHDPAESLWGRVIARQQSGWFASAAFRKTYAKVLSGEDHGVLPFISFKTWTWASPQDLITRYPEARAVLECDDLQAALSFMRSGMAVSRTPWFIGHADAQLEHVPELPLRNYAPIWVLTHPDLRENALVRSFMTFIAGRFSARDECYSGPAS